MVVAEIFDTCEFHDHKDTRLGRERSRVRLKKIYVMNLMNLVENIVCI